MSSDKTTEKKLKPATKYREMICVAIAALKERKGSSRQAVANYIKAHYKVGENFNIHLKMALKRGVTKGLFIQTTGSGATGRFKLSKKFPAKRSATKRMALKPREPAERLAPKPMIKKPKTMAKPRKTPTARRPAKQTGAKAEGEVAMVRRKNNGDEYANTECEMNSWAVEDDYEDEEESLEEKQKEVKKNGMIYVDPKGKWLKIVKGKLKDATGKVIEKEALAAITEASMATCIVHRGRNSKERIHFHERLARDASVPEEGKTHHMAKAEKARKGVVGSGTGMKLHRNVQFYDPFSDGSHCVVTNNHVIMNKEEADNATVTFDYHDDVNRETGTRTFKVCNLIESFPRTTGSGDKTNLDYSLLVLHAENNDDRLFLEHRGIHKSPFEPSHEFSRKDLFSAYPALMFSHPRGLAMRVSVGLYPDVAAGKCVSHINHKLPSCTGSSGANILISAELNFKEWIARFMHYRHGWAVVHRHIYLKKVEIYNREKGYEAMKPIITTGADL